MDRVLVRRGGMYNRFGGLVKGIMKGGKEVVRGGMGRVFKGMVFILFL
jgi:hypothetical protein